MEFNYIPTKEKEQKQTQENLALKVGGNRVLQMRQKVVEMLQKMKKKGQALSPKLKKWATSALAGSLVAGMLFMAGCDELNVPVDTTSNLDSSSIGLDSSSVINIGLETTSPTTEGLDLSSIESRPDFEAKKQMFMNLQSEDPEAGLKPYPHDYYKQMGLSDEEITKRVTCAYQYLTKDSLNAICVYYTPNCYTENKPVLVTWFKYEIGEENVNILNDLYQNSPNTRKILRGRTDFFGSYELRYALNEIFNSMESTVVAENYTYYYSINNSFENSVRLDDGYGCRLREHCPVIVKYTPNGAEAYFVLEIFKGAYDPMEERFEEERYELCKITDPAGNEYEFAIDGVPFSYVYKKQDLSKVMSSPNVTVETLDDVIYACEGNVKEEYNLVYLDMPENTK